MIVLALDTAGVWCSAALYDGARDLVLAERSEELGKGHAERLMDLIDAVLAEAQLPMQAIGRIGVTIGPGSFTGIRTGVATARGLSLALGVPSAGVTTLQVLAAAALLDHPGKPVLAAIDARRGEIYAQVFGPDCKPLAPAEAVDADAARALAISYQASVTGSAKALIEGHEASATPDHFSAALAARLVHGLNNPEKPKPLYLRAPDAKPQAGFAISRI